MYIVQCTMYNVHSVHCTLYNVHHVHCTLYNVYGVIVQCTWCTLYNVHGVHCTLCIVHTYMYNAHVYTCTCMYYVLSENEVSTCTFTSVSDSTVIIWKLVMSYIVHV